MRIAAVGLLLSAPAWLTLLVLAVDPRTTTEQDPAYDTNTVIEVTATVAEVRTVPAGKLLSGIHLIISADKVTMDVYLGPFEFVKEFDELPLVEGNRFQIVGSRVKTNAGMVLLAREVRKGGTTLYLRNNRGEPYWKR